MSKINGLQTVGLGRLVPNIVLIGLKTDWIQQNEKTPTQEKMKEINEYFAVIQSVYEKYSFDEFVNGNISEQHSIDLLVWPS